MMIEIEEDKRIPLLRPSDHSNGTEVNQEFCIKGEKNLPLSSSQHFGTSNRRKTTLFGEEDKKQFRNEVQEQFAKFSHVPFGSKRVDSKEERRFLRRKLWVYAVLDAVVICVDIAWLLTF